MSKKQLTAQHKSALCIFLALVDWASNLGNLQRKVGTQSITILVYTEGKENECSTERTMFLDNVQTSNFELSITFYKREVPSIFHLG